MNGQRLGKVEEGHWGAAPFTTASQEVEGGGSAVNLWRKVTRAQHLVCLSNQKGGQSVSGQMGKGGTGTWHTQGGTVHVREHKGCVSEGAGRG